MTPGSRNLAELFQTAVSGAPLNRHLAGVVGGSEVVYSTHEFRNATLALALRLRALGFMPGDRAALISENRPEWSIADFAIALAGGVSAPLYATLTPAQKAHIIEHSGARLALVSAAQQSTLPTGLPAVVIDGLPRSAPPAEAAGHLMAEAIDLPGHTLATIIYTSGTTGESKGVCLTHANLMSDVAMGMPRLKVSGFTQALSVLPLSHVFERMLCYGYFAERASIAYGDPYQALALFSRYRPEVFAAVPRILEKVHAAFQQRLEALPGPRRAFARWLMQVGRDRLSAPIVGASPRLYARLAGPLADRMLFAPLRAKLGGRVRLIISGGAALHPDTAWFLWSAGIPVVEGYGMTETSPVISVNPPTRVKLGTVGPPLEGVEVKFAEDGELLTRGPHVMQGYWNAPEATAAVFTDGWLRTGDLGFADEEGYLTLTGRKKELIVTAYGKNVPPAAVERSLLESPAIAHALLVGDRRPYCTALIAPARDALLAEAGRRGWHGRSYEELLGTPEVHEWIRQEIEPRQAAFAEFERVRRFTLVPDESFNDPSVLTPTQKLRRRPLELRFSSAIDDMYRDEHRA